MDLDSLKKLSEAVSHLDIPKFTTPEYFNPKIEIPDLPVIDPEDTIIGEIKRKIEEQNHLLSDNYVKLKDMYDSQSESYREAQEELRRSRKYNVSMMIISAVAMLAAIASPLVTLYVSR